MKNFTIYYNGRATYTANSKEEAITMFESDRFSGYEMNVNKTIEKEIEEDDEI